MANEFSNAVKEVENRLNVNWADTTPIKYDNVPFQEPQGVPWIAVFLLETIGDQISTNKPRHRFEGEIVIQIFTPLHQGSKVALDLASQAAAIFRRAQFGTTDSGFFTCMTPQIQPIGVEEGGWYQVNLAVPYKRDVDF